MIKYGCYVTLLLVNGTFHLKLRLAESRTMITYELRLPYIKAHLCHVMFLEVLIGILAGVHSEGDTDEQGKDFLCRSGNGGGGGSSFPLAFLFNQQASCVIYLSQ